MTWQGYHLITFVWVTTAICIILLAARLYVQWTFRPRMPWMEIFPIAAVVCLIAVAAEESVSNDLNLFAVDPTFEGVHSAEDMDRYMEIPLKLQYASAFTSRIAIYCCKFALLAFYMELSQCLKGVRLAINISWILLAGVLISQIIWLLAQCQPMERHWIWQYINNNKQCSRTYTFVMYSMVMHVFTDLVVFTIPFFILSKLRNLSSSQKMGAWGMFALGFLNVAMAIICAVLNFASTNDAQLGTYVFMTQLQFTSAAWIICLPYVRRLFKGMRGVKQGEDVVGVAEDTQQREEYGRCDVEHMAGESTSAGSKEKVTISTSADEK